MAVRTDVIRIDDFNGQDGADTVQFSIDGRHYEVDLTKENADELRSLLKPYIKKGRAVAPPSPKVEAAQIRKWAAANGYEVAARGRLHREIIEAYRNAKRV